MIGIGIGSIIRSIWVGIDFEIIGFDGDQIMISGSGIVDSISWDEWRESFVIL